MDIFCFLCIFVQGTTTFFDLDQMNPKIMFVFLANKTLFYLAEYLGQVKELLLDELF